MANFRGSAGAIERENLQLPLDRDGSGNETSGLVAGLILQFAGNREEFAFLWQRSPKFGTGIDSYVLTDAEGAFIDRDFFLDSGQIESLRRGIDFRFQFQPGDRFENQLDGFVTLGAGRVYVNIGG